MSAKKQNLARLLTMLLLAWCAHAAHGAVLYWPPNQYLPTLSPPAATIECISMDGIPTTEQTLFTSLEGIVNQTQPRLAVVTDTAEGEFAWLTIHNFNYATNYFTNAFQAILDYETNVTGLVVYDPHEWDTLNLATTIAGLKDELVCDPSLLHTLTNSPYNLAVKDDLRGKFSTKYQVYGYLYTNYWPQCTHRLIAGMGTNNFWNLRDYTIAMKVAVLWLDPTITADANTLSLFMNQMTPVGGVYLGFWPNEGGDMNWIGSYGIPVMASDDFDNASVYGGVISQISIPPIPPAPPLQNKIYVSLTMSDGDNVQEVEHRMKELWNSGWRGSVPIGWTIQPLLADFDPAILNYYWSTATTNDCLIAGPSGAGYAHIEHWSGANLAAFADASDPYLQRSGIRTITVWDTVSSAEADAYATNCPTLLGINDYDDGYYVTSDMGLPVIGFPAGGNYEGTTNALISAIQSAASGWSGSSPLFIDVEADSWLLDISEMYEVTKAFSPSTYLFVRPDQLFLLYQKSTGLSQGGALPYVATQPVSQFANPGDNVTFNVIATGTGPLSYQWQFDGTNVAGATNDSYTVSGAQAANLGYYQAVVTNLYGSALSAAATLALFGVDEVTNTVYYDVFGRSGLLNGSTPSPTDIGNATWYAWQQLITDGSALAVTNAAPKDANNNAFLPFTPQLNNIYTLSADIYGDYDINGSNIWWLAMGYSQSAMTNTYYGNVGAGWLLQRANNSQVQTFSGPGVTGVNSFSGPATAVTNSYSIILDTTVGNVASGWTVAFWENGTQLCQDTYASNPSLADVGVGADGATGDYYDFQLTDMFFPVTAPIYQDTFARKGALNGSTPAPSDATGATWYGWPQLATDGSELAVNTADPGQPPFNNAFLPFTPEAGHIYTLSASILGKTGDQNWLAFGYASSESTNVYYLDVGAAWMLQRCNDTNAQFFNGSSALAYSPDFPSSGLFNTWSIILNTTNTQWTVTFLMNGNYMTNFTYASNPTIQYVGIGANSGTGDFRNFSLVDQPISSTGGQLPLVVSNLVPEAGPQLQCVTQAPGQLTLTWPAVCQGWLLQSNSVGLFETNGWVTVPGSTLSYQISIPIDQSKVSVFFRLVSP
jgi:hypothetical protein